MIHHFKKGATVYQHYLYVKQTDCNKKIPISRTTTVFYKSYNHKYI